MKATNITGIPPGGERTPIAQLVPLDTPLLVQIFPIYLCNFKCKYCTFSVPKEKRGFISNVVKMSLDLFKKCIDDSQQFPQKIKVLRFVGMGEPLLHKNLHEMAYYASQSNKFENIEVLTNASLLKPEISDKLINAGLTKILISIQGTSNQKYKDISNVNIDLNKLLEYIKYYYDKSRNKSKIHIKIIDCALDDKYDKQRFFDLFGNICDTIGVERAGPIYPHVEYNQKLECTNINQYGVEHKDIDICTQPFLSMQINPDGNVVPCYSIDYPDIMGNCNNESLINIWNGKKYNDFRFKMLNGKHNICEVCKNCHIFVHRSYTDDDLSSKVTELKQFYKV